MSLLTRQSIPGVFSGGAYNQNLSLIENGLLGLGGLVVSGLTMTAGTGLTVNVSTGAALLGGDLEVTTPFVVTGLGDNTVNDIYLMNDGSGQSLSHPSIQPANSTKLGTATTAAGAVSSVSQTQSSGRNQWVLPQNLILGGPGAGNPPSQNLASWNATAGDGFSFYGMLPAGAMNLSGAAILAPATPGRNTIQPTADANGALLLKRHSSTLTGAPLLQLLDQTGAVLAILSTTGAYGFGANPGSTDCWVTGTAANAIALTLRASSSNDSLQCLNAAGNGVLFVSDDTGIDVVNIQSNTTGCIPLLVQGPFGGGMTVDIARFQASGSIFTGPLLAVEPSIALRFALLDSAAAEVAVSRIECGFLSNSTGATKGRGLLFGVDSAAKREAMRWEADGAAARIGFLGATAAIQQPTASTAGIAGIRTDTLAHAVSDIQTILTALRGPFVTFGLTANTA